MIQKIKKVLEPYRWLRYMLKNEHLTLGELRTGHLSFSQFGEDILLESFFGRDNVDGFYVDIGAFNPIVISNTYLFYRKGWRGINIEPNPKHFELFPVKRSNDINLNMAVSDQKSTVKFSCDGVYSGIRDGDYLFTNRNPGAQVIEVETFTLKEILDKHLPTGKPIDFMTIDCEGHDFKVVKSNDWTTYRPRVVAVEQHGSSVESDVYELLARVGYRFYCKIGLTMLFIIKEESARYLPGNQ